ncbi:MAG TPA: hypothetical protein VHX88_13120 [Solirubrobacteraceae bacterium]|jgi:hypothetical protein|nr:hypothetical protein [Solirubrobacteraceae bacterium]
MRIQRLPADAIDGGQLRRTVCRAGRECYAATQVATSAKHTAKKHKKKPKVTYETKAQVKKLINNAAPGLSVAYAKSAGAASTATIASTAGTASSATNATNATNLGGQPPSAFEPSAEFARSGLVTASSGNAAMLASFGPFTVTLKCDAGSGTDVEAELDATSTASNSQAFGTALTPGAATQIMNDGACGATTPSSSFVDLDDNNFEFTANGSVWLSYIEFGHDLPSDAGSTCWAAALTTTSEAPPASARAGR